MAQLDESPLYRIIAEDLIREIKVGDYDASKPLCTEKSLCQRYNVSRITAKKAIEMVEKEGLIYRMRGRGSFVKEGAVIIKEPVDVYLPKNVALVAPFSITKGGLFIAIEAAALDLAEADCFFSLHMHKKEDEMLMALRKLDISGLLYYPSGVVRMDLMKPFIESGKPVVVLDKPHNEPSCSSITCDNYDGGRLLTKHLLVYGHRKTAYLSRFTEKLSSVRDRYKGYVDTLKESGRGLQPRFIKLDTPPNSPPSHDLLRHIIITLRNEGVTALLCENDEVAFYVYLCCMSLGLSVPQNISVVGFDNTEWSVTSGLQITTIDQNFALIGQAIAKVLTAAEYRPQHIRIPVKLIPRASSGYCSDEPVDI
ncbi:MAG: GntR family transcriptional regulator [Clostridiales bacterium]|jgi:DNA-binding LacI/PurR family transcriptional regulator|nr:GntR family transcriptional regulator [Clostridiales bacterium]